MKKIAILLNKSIYLIFLFVMMAILVATLLIDKHIENPFPNTVRYANGGYYFFAVLLLLFFIRFAMKYKIRDEKAFYVLLAGIVMLTFLIQLLISFWFPVDIGADFAVCKNTAIALSKGGTFKGMQYFQTYPNNVNITITFSVIYSIFGNWRAVILIGAFLTNISVLLAALSVYNCTGSKSACLLTELCGVVLIALTWRTFIPYTDNFGTIFVAVIIWAYTSHFNSFYKFIIILAAGIFGGLYIKATIWITIISAAAHFVLHCLACDDKVIHWKKMAVYGIIICIAFGGAKLAEKKIQKYFGYAEVEAAFGWQCQFMLGQNDQYFGTYNDADTCFAAEITDNKERERVCLAEAIRRIKARKIMGNVKFYMKKLNIAYNDGYFNNVQWDCECKDNFLAKLYLKNGSYYDWGADILQVLWDFILLTTAFGSFLKKKDNSPAMFPILIIGITLYILIFQNRSKYLYMFLPVYVAYAGIVFHGILDWVMERRFSAN